MSFSIKLPKEKIDLIDSWKLSPRLLREILEHLYEELAVTPHRHLVKIPESDEHLQYSVIVHNEGDPPNDYLFEFSVRYGADEETLFINDYRYLQIPSGS